jgi:hypothetical protein
MKTLMPRGKALLRAMLVLSGVAIATTGCIYGPPPPYAYGGGPSDGYAPNYAYAPAPNYDAPGYPPNYTYAPAPNYYAPGYAYGPGFYFGPSIVFGGGWGHEGRRGRR